MSQQTTLIPTEEQEAVRLPAIRQDEIAEEVFAARLYAKRLTRTVVMAQSILLVLFALCIYGLAVRPAKRVYIKLDQFGRATPVKYSDLEHYTPDAAVAKSYLADWATFRFGRLRASVLKTFPQNYLFLEAKYGQQIRERDQKENFVAKILAGHEPENDVTILSTNLTSVRQTEPRHFDRGRGHGGHRAAENVHQRRFDAHTDLDHCGALLSESRPGRCAECGQSRLPNHQSAWLDDCGVYCQPGQCGGGAKAMNCLEELILPFFRSMGLDRYLVDPEVSELMITNGLVFVEHGGQMNEIDGIRIDERKLRAGVEIIGQSIGDQIDEYHKPWLDSRLPDGSRVAATYPPISPQGVMVTIRKFLRHFTTEELVERGALTPEVLNIVVAAVHARKNVLVSGGTSTGKTTMTNAFVRHIPAHERIVVIEKPVEMKLDHRNSPRLEAYPKVGDRPEVTVSQLLSLTLRHRPDRIIVGEVKDSEAAYGLAASDEYGA